MKHNYASAWILRVPPGETELIYCLTLPSVLNFLPLANFDSVQTEVSYKCGILCSVPNFAVRILLRSGDSAAQ